MIAYGPVAAEALCLQCVGCEGCTGPSLGATKCSGLTQFGRVASQTRGEYDRLKRPAQCSSNLESIETLLKHDSRVGDIKPKSNGRIVNPDLKGWRRANDSLSEPRLHRRAGCRYRRVCSASGQVRSRHRLEMQPDAGRDQLCASGRPIMLSNAPVTTPECKPTQDPAQVLRLGGDGPAD